MSTVPASRVAKIEFCEDHIALWTANAVAMGSAAPTVTAWEAKVVAARAALQMQKEAQIAARNATINFNMALNAMNLATSEIIKQVRAKAASGGEAIYSLAGIPVPATPAPRQPPGTPYEFKIELDQSGIVTLRWKCENPVGTSGTMYQVWRRIGNATDFVSLGGSGVREFIDDAIPLGVTRFTYKLRAVRSTVAGPWAEFSVNFGTNGIGVVTNVSEPIAKLAA